MRTEGENGVARRRVFYIPGYDPHPPRRYRELYRTESVKQSLISGFRIEQKSDGGDTGWSVRADIEGARVQSRIDVLVWHDLVQDSMQTSIPHTYWVLVKTAWIYLSTGALRRLSWLAKGPVLAALYPVAMLLLQLVMALGLGSFLGGYAGSVITETIAAVGRLLGFAPDPTSGVLGILGTLLYWVILLPVTVVVLRWFKGHDDKLFAYYLMHDFAYTASEKGAYPEAIETRLALFRERITAALDEPVDEVLVIGHSSGAHLAVSLVADVLRDRPAGGPALSLLTLGQVIPMVSFLPEAHRLRADLQALSVSDRITWLDVSAPGDGCSFALAEPVAVSGVAPKDGQLWPVVISAAFSKTLKSETLRKLKHRYFRLHFQYLCAFDQPGDYDYFKITAGPKTLGARFAGRQSSKSRIDVAASRFTSTVAGSE
ncbi:MAG: hypothetical protein ACU0GG_15535 [Paracoccaceae bacterium]